jgi:hypothetical protein
MKDAGTFCKAASWYRGVMVLMPGLVNWKQVGLYMQKFALGRSASDNIIML